jgi:hypothetical protein
MIPTRAIGIYATNLVFSYIFVILVVYICLDTPKFDPD